MAEPDPAAAQAYRKRQEVARRALEERLPRMVALAGRADRDLDPLGQQVRAGVLEDHLLAVVSTGHSRVLFRFIGSLGAERRARLSRGERIEFPLTEAPDAARELLQRLYAKVSPDAPKGPAANPMPDLTDAKSWTVSVGRMPYGVRLNELSVSLGLSQKPPLTWGVTSSVPLPGADVADPDTYRLRLPEVAAGLELAPRPLPAMLQAQEFRGPRSAWPAEVSFASGFAVVTDYYSAGYGEQYIRPRGRGKMPEGTLDDYLDRMARGPLEVRWGYVGKVIVVQSLERALMLAGPLAPWLDTGK